MRRGERRTPIGIAAGVVAATLLLSGCSMHVDAGSAAADEAESALSRIDGVASVRANGTNNLPFAGTASATVVTDDHLSDTALHDLTDAVGRWVHGRHSTTASIEADGYRFPVRSTAVLNARQLAVVDGLRHDDRWIGGDVQSPTAPGTVQPTPSIVLTVGKPADLVAGWDAVRQTGADSGWDEVEVSAEAWNAAPADVVDRYHPDFTIAEAGDTADVTRGDPTAEVEAFRQVQAAYPVTAAEVRPGRVHLHVRDLADVPAATAVVTRTAPDAVAVVDGGIVTKDDSGDPGERPGPSAFTEVDRLAAVATRDGVTAITEKPAWLSVTATGTDTALATAAALVAASPATSMGTIEVASSAAALEDRGDDGLLIRGSPARFVDAVRVAAQLPDFQPARAALFATNASVTVTVSGVDEVPALVAALKPVLPDGTRLQVGLRGEDSAASAGQLTLHGGTMTVDEPRSPAAEDETRSRLGPTVRDAWNG